MTADVPEIIDVERYGSRGWFFTAVWRQGRPGEFSRAFRTSRTGKGLEALWGVSGWRSCTWADQDWQWPRVREQFEKQIRITMRSANYPARGGRR